MRRFALGCALALALAFFIGSPVAADYYEYDSADAPQVDVEYTIGNGVGELTVVGGAGLPLEAFDAAGVPLAGTVMFSSVTSVSIPATGSSSVLYVRVGNQWYEVSATGSDPDWNYD